MNKKEKRKNKLVGKSGKRLFLNTSEKEKFKIFIRRRFGVISGSEKDFIFLTTGINADWEWMTEKQYNLIMQEFSKL